MSNTAQLTAESRKEEIEIAALFHPEDLLAFVSKAWDGKRNYECTTAPFRRAASNPDPSKFEQIAVSEIGTASQLWIENGVRVFGWM
jgi:hypothetical protein